MDLDPEGVIENLEARRNAVARLMEGLLGAGPVLDAVKDERDRLVRLLVAEENAEFRGGIKALNWLLSMPERTAGEVETLQTALSGDPDEGPDAGLLG